MKSRQFSMKAALDLLGIRPPKVSKKQSQDEIDKMLKEWKETTLTEHYKAERRKWHPDLHQESTEATEAATLRFQQLGTAYEEVLEHLQLRKPRTPPEKVTHCRSCNADRIPRDAAHCWKCGLRYESRELRTRCPVCDVGRNPTQARFCYHCGYDYQVPDGLIERLRSIGYTEADIQHYTANGQIDRWRRLPATSKELADAIHFELQKRKVIRGGHGDFGSLFGGGGFR